MVVANLSFPTDIKIVNFIDDHATLEHSSQECLFYALVVSEKEIFKHKFPHVDL
jgi:hypothetical protein